MSSRLTLAEENMITVMLLQALVGAVSANIRMITLSLEAPVWKLQFVLESESTEDREEIEDIAGEFDGLLLALDRRELRFEVETLVSTERLGCPEPPARVVFKRKE